MPCLWHIVPSLQPDSIGSGCKRTDPCSMQLAMEEYRIHWLGQNWKILSPRGRMGLQLVFNALSAHACIIASHACALNSCIVHSSCSLGSMIVVQYMTANGLWTQWNKMEEVCLTGLGRGKRVSCCVPELFLSHRGGDGSFWRALKQKVLKIQTEKCQTVTDKMPVNAAQLFEPVTFDDCVSAGKEDRHALVKSALIKQVFGMLCPVCVLPASKGKKEKVSEQKPGVSFLFNQMVSKALTQHFHLDFFGPSFLWEIFHKDLLKKTL